MTCRNSFSTKISPKRGQGGRCKVTENNSIPSNWHNFLRHNSNKSGLFDFLADKITEMSVPNLVIVTKGTKALSNHNVSLLELNNCSHEEADGRIFVHARYAASQGSKSIMVKANDTDVLVIGLRPHLHARKHSFFFLRLPRHHFKNICVHMDPQKTTENAVVHIPGL